MLKLIQITKKHFYKFILCFLLGIWLFVNISPVMSQNKPEDITANDAINLIDEAEELYYKANKDSQDNPYYEAAEKLKKAINVLTKQEKLDKFYQENLAISYTNLGTLKLLLGQANDALENWQEATFIYEQLNNSTEVRNSLILQAKALDKLSFAPRACHILIEALGIETEKNQQVIQQEIDSHEDKENCQNVKFTPKMIQQVQQKFVNNNQSNYRKGLILLGNVLRKIGELNDSQIVLEETLKFSQEKTLQAAINFSLGDTLKAKGDLYYLRQSPPKYDYQPWKFYPRNLENSNNVQQKNQDTNRNCNNAQQCYQEANEKYQNAIKLAPSKEVYIKSQVKSLNLSLILGDINKAQELASNIKLLDLPKTVSTVYTQINYAKSLAYLQQLKPEPIDQQNGTIDIIQNAIIDAEDIKNEYCYLKATNVAKQEKRELNSSEQYCLKYNRAESYALGNLGGLYEYLGDLQLAEQYTQKALYIAQPSEDPDLAYQWQWQLGRLFNAEGKTEEAIAFYENAVKTLESVRGDLLTINTDVQFNFRDNVEPVYRELVDLLLQPSQPSQQNLQMALDLIDSLRLAELQNFLSCDLSNPDEDKLEKIEDLDQEAAFIYPVILKDRLEIILKLPTNKELLNFCTTNKENRDNCQKIESTELETLLDNIQREQYRKSGKTPIDKYGKELYQWLIKPLEPQLEPLRLSGKIKTLVFLLDGSLRNISLSTLNKEKENLKKQEDKKNIYLIEQYAIATIYSRNLTQQNLNNQSLNVLTAGISQARNFPEFRSFGALKCVPLELKGVQKIMKSANTSLLNESFEESKCYQDESEGVQKIMESANTSLLNESFTTENLTNEINNSNASILHIATHGNFSSDPNQTFLVAWNDLIKAKNFDEILQRNNRQQNSNLKLLVLSACKTATGDRRSTLGLAGIAVQGGVETTLASLWSVNDKSTAEFMIEFYRNLKKETNIAIALQKTQLHFLQDSNEYKAPYYWSPFIIVGNWIK